MHINNVINHICIGTNIVYIPIILICTERRSKAEPILINGLLRLEYRGYDSAGIATIENNGIKNIKNKGRVNDLLSVKGIENLKVNLPDCDYIIINE